MSLKFPSSSGIYDLLPLPFYQLRKLEISLPICQTHHNRGRAPCTPAKWLSSPNLLNTIFPKGAKIPYYTILHSRDHPPPPIRHIMIHEPSPNLVFSSTTLGQSPQGKSQTPIKFPSIFCVLRFCIEPSRPYCVWVCARYSYTPEPNRINFLQDRDYVLHTPFSNYAHYD